MIRVSAIRNTLAALLLGASIGAPALPLLQGSMQAAHAAANTVNLASFVGTWSNVNPNTPSIVALRVNRYVSPSDFNVSYNLGTWGACHPTACAWGTANLVAGTSYATALYRFSFAIKTVRVWRDGTFLRTLTHTHFTDNSGRHDYDSYDTLYRTS
jgi:hypothetical protein